MHPGILGTKECGILVVIKLHVSWYMHVDEKLDYWLHRRQLQQICIESNNFRFRQQYYYFGRGAKQLELCVP
jgi:hypothetical protein